MNTIIEFLVETKTYKEELDKAFLTLTTKPLTRVQLLDQIHIIQEACFNIKADVNSFESSFFTDL